MFVTLRDFFRPRIEAEADGPGPSGERALQMAAAALLFEIVRADGDVKAEERTVMEAAVQGTFGLSADDTRELVRLAEAQSRSAISLFEFTCVVDEAFSAEQKKRVVELLWLVAFADGRLNGERPRTSKENPERGQQADAAADIHGLQMSYFGWPGSMVGTGRDGGATMPLGFLPSRNSVMARSSIMLVVRSASCSVCMASSASGTSARTWAAAATTSWESLGFLFWGMVLLPTVPGGTGSSTSPNSCFISV